MNALWEEEQDNKKQRQLKDVDDAARLLEKEQQKIDMDLAAKYIQRKWNWFQTEGKFLAKKRKGKKGKKGKKKKWENNTSYYIIIVGLNQVKIL